MNCQIDKGRLFKGDLRLYIKNDHELWLHLDGSVGFIHWNKDFHICNLNQDTEVVTSDVISGMPSATIVATAASSAYSNLPYTVVASALAMISPSADNEVETS